MFFDQIIGQQPLINHLKQTVHNDRIAHAQLFVGNEGCGTLLTAIAYAQYILCYEGDESAKIQSNKLQHPDLHFAFPTATNDKIKKHPVSNLFLEDWRNFVLNNPYGNLFDWYQHIGIENKQGQIGVDEAQEIVKSLQLKSFEGGYKIMIIWMAEKMNNAAANKLLKLIEEPPVKTIFLLVTENKDQIINTIYSRCQVLEFPNLSENDLVKALESKNLDINNAYKIAHQCEGNYNKAIKLINQSHQQNPFEELFIIWVRAAFKAKGNASVIQNLIEWSDKIASFGREEQKEFLLFCLQIFRQAMLFNYGSKNLVFYEFIDANFKIEKFAPFIHGQNIEDIYKELNDAIYHIERNGNAKIILLDTSIKLTRLLHTKPITL